MKTLALIIAVLHAYPHAPLDRVTEVVLRASRGSIPPELAVVIAEHESDWKPNAVSYVVAGRRRDIAYHRGALPAHVTCGYLQASLPGAACADAIAKDGGWSDGETQILEAIRQGGSVRAGLEWYACGRRGPCAFATLFYQRARKLGWDGR